MKRLFFLFVGLCLYTSSVLAQAGAQTAPVQEVFGGEKPDTSDASYWRALQELKGMLAGEMPISFKRAVFITESTYFNNTLNYNKFCKAIDSLMILSDLFTQHNSLIYTHEDKEEVAKYAAAFKVMTDTLRVRISKSGYLVHYPFRYDFDDIWGEKEWSQMFVSKLLTTRKGNCHSLPFLYKILVEEMGGKAYLAMAPSHIYIKQRCKSIGWYNTELTNPSFPVDAWIMASGYIPTEAVISGIYMDTLSDKQSLAVCIIDLANGYQKKHGVKDGKFILGCCQVALEQYPNYVNTLMLKAETYKKLFEQMMQHAGAVHPSAIFHNQQAKTLFETIEQTYFKIHQLGYRKMPKEMYLRWLSELNVEKKKYNNPQINKTLNNK